MSPEPRPRRTALVVRSALQRLAIVVPQPEAEQARAIMIELAPDGFEEREVGDEIELAVYADPEREARVRAAFGQLAAEDVAPGWEHAWRAFHHPVVVGGIWVGPPWAEPPARLPTVVVDPGQAFGTGAHPTTRLCIELLSDVERGSLLDLGCGSGVLALAATRLGFAPVLAVDNDPVAVAVARENADANGVTLDVRLWDVTKDPLPKVDVAVANILLQPVEAVLQLLDADTVVTSGYLSGEWPAAPHWSHRARLERDGWAADRWVARRSG